MKFPLSTSFLALVATVANPIILASAQSITLAEVCESELAYKYDSGETKSASVTISPEAASGSEWIQLDLSYTVLASNAELVLTGPDGFSETLTADKLESNGWSSVFPGDSVDVTLVTPGNTRGNGNKSRVVVTAVKAGVCDDQPPASICGDVDDRIPSTDVRAGRIGGCTGWLISENVFLQAGHCGAPSASTRIHFTYGVSSAPLADQYAVEAGSYVSSDDYPGGTKYGQDFGIGRLLPNSETGLLPGVAQSNKCGPGTDCGWYDIGTVPGSTGGITMRVTGYGTASVASRSQKTHTGPLVEIVANAGTSQYYLRYGMDTTGGNSGSPAIREDTGQAIGIHTHGGCSATGGANAGTRIDHPLLAPLISGYLTPCASDADCDDGDDSNGIETCSATGNCVRGSPPTMAPTPCVGGTYMEVSINTDNYPAETSYVLTDMCTSTEVANVPSGTYSSSGTSYTDSYCVEENHEFQFQISDSYGDGMCCGYGTGSYSIDYMGQVHTSPSGGSFGSGETIAFGSCGGGAPTTSSPTKAPTNAPVDPPTTSAPTGAPITSAPSGAPTDAPTDAPVTSAPTNAPATSAPVATPVNCVNDDSFRVLANNGRTKRCNWVGKRTNTRCDLVGVDGVTTTYEACPEDCNPACN